MNRIASSVSNAASVYQLASENIKTKSIKLFLEKTAAEKEAHLSSLNTKLPTDSSSESNGTLSKSFLKHLKLKDSTEGMLVGCINYEEEVIKAYQEALISGDIPKNRQQVYLEQLHESLASYNQLKMMKESRHYQHNEVNK